MKFFQCSCGQPLFFDNAICLKCGAALGFDPGRRLLGAVREGENGGWTLDFDKYSGATEYRFCDNRTTAAACNWLVPAHENATLCLSCRLTRTLPALTGPRNAERWRVVESAKRRVLFSLLESNLPVASMSEDPGRGLAFDFLESGPGDPPVVTGHKEGLITLDVAEADDDYRARHRESLTEPYRTVIGHLRHELAHYYWDRLVRDTNWLPRFREVFGDDRADYATSLQRYYGEGPPPDWSTRFISAYASSHPWEDWAESWAHYFHLRATLETASQFGLGDVRLPTRVDLFPDAALYDAEPKAAAASFLERIRSWVILTTALNEVSRSMGQPDLYPFVLNAPAVRKLHFVHCLVRYRTHG